MGVFRNLTNQKFGYLIVIKPIKKNRKYYWLCQCNCGNNKIIQGTALTSNKTKSCGCFRKKTTSIQGKKNIKHGHSSNNKKTIFYKKWVGIKSRCLNEKVQDYYRYGGRGIKVCDSWLEFKNFRDDMYKSYLKHVKEFGEKDTTIERINNNGNYCKENCKWITWKEQYENKSNLRFITYKNKKQTLAKWSKELELNATTISDRLKAGWGIEDALFQRVSPLKLKLRIKN